MPEVLPASPLWQPATSASNTRQAGLKAPGPLSDFRQVLAVQIDISPVVLEFFLQLAFQYLSPRPANRQAVDDIDHQMKAVQFVQDGHVEWRGDGALLLVARTWILRWLFRRYVRRCTSEG